MESIIENSTESSVPYETDFTRNLKFGIFVALEPPSLICASVLLSFLIINRTLRQSLHCHSLLAILFVSLLTNIFDVIRIADFLYRGIGMPQTKINCLVWQWYDMVFYGHGNILLCWASVERYMLIFHGNKFNTHKRRLYFHYLPYLVISTYISMFYAGVIFFIPCDQFDFTVITCGIPCYSYQTSIALYDNIVNNWLPLILNIVLSIVLIIRVLYRKPVNQQQRTQRSKHRKLVLQILLISALHLACILPYALVVFIQVVANTPDFALYIRSSLLLLYILSTFTSSAICMHRLPARSAEEN